MSCRYLAMLSRKITSVVSNMDSEQQRMFYEAREMLHKAGQKKHEGHFSIFTRWHNDYEYRNSLSFVGWTEQDILLFDNCFGKSFIRRNKR